MYGIFHVLDGAWVQHGTDYVNRSDAELEADIFTALTGRKATVMIRCNNLPELIKSRRVEAMAEIAETERLKLRYS